MFHTLLLLFYRFLCSEILIVLLLLLFMYVTVIPVSAYTALAFVFGFIQLYQYFDGCRQSTFVRQP